MTDVLGGVPGVLAVVLGGSRARGTHHAGSDVDLGIYYDRDALDVDALTRAARVLDDSGGDGAHDTGAVEISGPGGWGPWVDGGGWLTIDGTPVDWILRDVERVREQCRRAVAGQFAFHAQPGHPLGFLDVSYAGEVAGCLPLADPHGIVADLRAPLHPYPPALRSAVVATVWQAGFLVVAARKGLPRRDSTYVLLSCTTALMICAHAWHAAAGCWAVNEKGLVPDVARLDLDTHDFAARAHRALTGHGPDRLGDVVDDVAVLVDDTTRALSTVGGLVQH